MSSNVRVITPRNRLIPGFVSGRYYCLTEASVPASASIGTVGTVIYLIPFATKDVPFNCNSLNIRVVTGAGSSAAKLAVWANDPLTGRPTGLPVIGSNTGQSTASSNTLATVAVSYVFPVGAFFWFGAAFTTAGPSVQCMGNNNGMTQNLQLGWGGTLTGVNNNVTGLTAPFTYGNDIMALDLTAATYTDLIGTAGGPLLWAGAA